MSKKKIVKNKDGLIINTSFELRNKIKFHYEERYFNIFMNKFDFKNSLSYQQINYILRKLWADGTISAFKREINNVINYPYYYRLLTDRAVIQRLGYDEHNKRHQKHYGETDDSSLLLIDIKL